MALDTVYLGQSFESNVMFKGNNEEPLNLTHPAQYTITDFNGYKVLSGIGAQDTQNPYLFKADVTIPESAPASHDKKYSVQWQVRSQQGTFSSTEYFTVLPQSDFEYTEVDSVFLAGTEISDSLVLDAIPGPITQIEARISSTDGTEIESVAVDEDPVLIDGRKVVNATFESELSASLEPYIIQWSYRVGGKTRREFHFVYMVDQKTILRMEQLRNYIDKLRFSHPNPNLRFNDVDLIGYLVQGTQMINAVKPQVTNFTISSIPNTFDWFLTNAAAYVALSAQYIAEGEQAFDFSGQTVSLTVDRTQVLDSALGRIQEIISSSGSALTDAKTLYAKSAARPVLGISPSPCLNPRFLSLQFYGNGGAPYFWLGNRLNFYQGLLADLSYI